MSTAPQLSVRTSQTRLAGQAVREALSGTDSRRLLQLSLGLIWLIDAALQFQPYMFSRAFVTGTIEPAVSSGPGIVAHPGLWAAHLMLHHIVAYNAVFAVTQLVIALAIFYRPTVRIGLAISVIWGVCVWWFGEGIGGVTTGASPVSGAPGAVIVYVLLAVLLWPPKAGVEPGLSVAESGPLGSSFARATWAMLWLSLAYFGLEPANRAPAALQGALASMESGEPGWIQAIDRGLAQALAHHGTEVSIVTVVLFVAIAATCVLRFGRRPVLVIALVVAALLWVGEDFGGIFTGSGTDVNTGPLLALLALSFWPVWSTSRPAPEGGARLRRNRPTASLPS